MANEGTLWFKDLTVPDSTGVLPVMLGVANLLNTEVIYQIVFGFCLSTK